MIRSLFGSETTVGLLRAGLDDQSARHRELSDRIANLMTPGQAADFATTLQQELASQQAVESDIHREMVSLADLAVRFDTTALLLQRTYQQFRTAIRNA